MGPHEQTWAPVSFSSLGQYALLCEPIRVLGGNCFLSHTVSCPDTLPHYWRTKLPSQMSGLPQWTLASVPRTAPQKILFLQFEVWQTVLNTQFIKMCENFYLAAHVHI